MKTIWHIINFEWKGLSRSRTLQTLILIVLGTGVYGIYFGKFEIEKQESRIAQVELLEKQQFDSLLVWASLDTAITENKEKYLQAVSPTGTGWNKHFTYYMANQTPMGAGLCLGQRDIFPVYYGLNVTDLSRQVNVVELANPMKLLTGNFDLSYVFVFLFPLLVIALFYNLYAVEKEGGTLPLLLSQSFPLSMILVSKGLLRLLIVWALASVLLFLGFMLQGISIQDNSQLFVEWLFVVNGYCLVWTLIMAIVVGLRRKSALSAVLGLGVWLIFTLIIPAMLNLFVSADEPLPNRTDMVHSIRNLNDRFWASPKSLVFDEFYATNPEFNLGDTTHFYKWYYAGFTLLDKQADQLKMEFEHQVEKRNSMLSRWEWLAPAAMVHEQLSQLSATDRQSHLNFMQEVQRYHNELKNLYYQRIFDDEYFSLKDLKNLQNKL